MQPAHRRQDRGNSIGALHPEKVLSKAFRTRVRFPPPPPKRKGRTSVRPFLFASMGCWSGPASARQQWIWRRRASSAGLDSRLHFCAPLFLFMAMLPNRTCLHPSAMDMATPRVVGSRFSPVLSRGESQVLFLSKTLPQALSRFYRRKQLFHVYISSAPLDGETRSVVKYTYARPSHHDLCV